MNRLEPLEQEQELQRGSSERGCELNNDGDSAGEVEKVQDVDYGSNEEDVVGDENIEAVKVVKEEEVVISINAEGKVVELADQVSDYTMRPKEMEGLCLWDFVTKTVKVFARKSCGWAVMTMWRMTRRNWMVNQNLETTVL